LGRPLASIGLFWLLLLIVLITLPFLLLALITDLIRYWLWLRRQDQTRISASTKEVAERGLRENYVKESRASPEPVSFEDWKKKKGDKWISNKEDRVATPVLFKVFELETKFLFKRPWEKLVELVMEWRMRLDSTVLIGLAPFHSYSFDEEQKSAKAPLQIFAASIRRLRLGLSDRMIVNHVRFITIPEIVRIESEEDARRWRIRLGLDTLMWGSYLSTNPPRIWLNFENKPQVENTTNDEFDRTESLDWDPVRTKEVDFAMMEVDQDDQIECYLVVLTCLLRTLQHRPHLS
jgi:hypothetical protein